MAKFNELRNEFLRNPNLTLQEREVIKDVMLDTKETIGQANWLIIEEKRVSQGEAPDLSDKELKDIQNPQPHSSLEKVIQVLNKHEIYLNNLINYAKEKSAGEQVQSVQIDGNKSRSLKEKVLSSLPEWTILVAVVEGEGFSNGKEEVLKNELTEENFQEIRRAIIENIKLNKDEWETKKVITCFERKLPAVTFPQEECLMLIHRSVQPRYNKASLIFEYGKMYYRGAFTSQEWAEIEQSLSQSQQQAQVEQPPTKFNFSFGSSDSGKY